MSRRHAVRMGTLALAAFVAQAAPARAQEPIADNSFLIEEAYNQERGVVQHISTFSRARGTGDWAYTFTQEWPVPGQRHQLSYTLPVARLHESAGAFTGVGDVALHYRFQALGLGETSVALAPRLSLFVPTGRSADGLGAGGTAIQLGVPASWRLGSRLVTHWNVLATRTIAARDAAGRRASTTSFAAGQSVVWLARPRLNLLVETLWTRAGVVAGEGVAGHADGLVVSPGLRFAHDFRGGLQVVPGVAFTIGVGPSRGQNAVFLYLSFEHPFRRAVEAGAGDAAR